MLLACFIHDPLRRLRQEDPPSEAIVSVFNKIASNQMFSPPGALCDRHPHALLRKGVAFKLPLHISALCLCCSPDFQFSQFSTK